MNKGSPLWTYICFLLIITLIIPPIMPRVDAGGIPVIDVSSIAQLLQQYMTLQKQLDAMKQNLKHFTKISSKLISKARSIIFGSFDKIAAVQKSVKGLVFNTSEIDKAWDKTYKTTEQMNTMNNSEYAEHLQTLDEKTSNALLDAMRAQSLISEIDKDKEILDSLLQESDGAEGMLEAMQIGNQISSIQISQLARMQTIMAMSYRAQAMYYQWEMQEKMSHRAYVNKNQIKMENPVQSNFTQTEFPQF